MMDRHLGSLDPGYVGDATCESCHREIFQEYRRTNHGRSLSQLSPEEDPADWRQIPPGPEWKRDARVSSPADGLLYNVSPGPDEPRQQETLDGPDGSTLHELSREAHLVIGSGNQTRSFLTIENGRITQLPLTWYSTDQRWGMSPGFAEINDRFSRPLILQCLACHTDLPVLEPHTQNAYAESPGPISCERCHGPGRAHVEGHQKEADERETGLVSRQGSDPWIITPTRLDREREMAICLQCHLAGIVTHPEGEDPTTFRPGMALAENRTVHVPTLQFQDPEWVGIDSHPIRLARSACYQESEMTCLSCHAAHTPDQELPPEHFARQCGACHTGNGEHSAGDGTASPLCSRHGRDGLAQEGSSGDCVSCHMSRGGTSDVPHVRFTDHWIQREPGPPLDPEGGRSVIESPDPLALVEVSPLARPVDPSDPDHRTEAEQAAHRADALFQLYETMHRHPGYLPQVMTAGRTAQRSPGEPTPAGQLAFARALMETGATTEARSILLQALERFPDDPWVHLLLGALMEERLGDPEGALHHLEQALQIQPRLLEARGKRAQVLFGLGRVDEAKADLRRLVQEAPLQRPQAWFNLGVIHLTLGEEEAAEAAFREAVRLDPLAGDAAVQLGSLQMARGDLVEAERSFQLAVHGDPSNPSGHGSLALLQLEQGRVAEAISSLETVLELEPDHPEAQALLEALGRTPGS